MTGKEKCEFLKKIRAHLATYIYKAFVGKGKRTKEKNG
jgi:hypothetical protein